MKTETNWKTEVRRHTEFVEDNFFQLEDDFLVTALVGSQNYGLATESSDVDTKMIFLPGVPRLANQSVMVSKTIELDNHEFCDVKDVRFFLKTVLKGNPNFLEVLYSNHVHVNSAFTKSWEWLVQNRDNILFSNPRNVISATLGTCQSKFAALTKSSPARREVIDKFGYDGKSLCHLIRCHKLLTDYLNGISFSDSLSVAGTVEYDMMLEAKQQKFTVEQATRIAKAELSSAHLLVEHGEEQIKHLETLVDTESFLKELQEWTVTLLKEHFYNFM